MLLLAWEDRLKQILHTTGCPAKHDPLVFLNFSASLGSRNSILDIFQLPFSCRFQRYPLFYYLVKSRLRYCQNMTGKSFQKLTFFVYCWIQHLITQQPLWEVAACISIHKHSQAPLSTSEQQWVSCHFTMSTHECSWALMGTHCALELWSSVLMWTNEHKWVLVSAHGVMAPC